MTKVSCRAQAPQKRGTALATTVGGEGSPTLHIAERHQAYRSYSYLRAGVDYQDFTLCAEINRVPPYQTASLSDEQQAQVDRLLTDSLVISLHDHPSVMPEDVTMAGWKWTDVIADVIADVGMRLCDIAHQDYVVLATSVQGIKDAHASGRLALGRAAVERMNRLGMAIDISHSGDQTCLDVVSASRVAVFITHAGSRTVWNSNRMKPDEVIVACAERGGVIGLEAAPHTNLSAAHPRHSLELVMDHFTHLVDLIGIDHVAFGPDTMFGDHVGLHNMFTAAMSIDAAHTEQEFPKVEYVDGLENRADCFHNIIGWLVEHAYSDDDIRKVVGENIARVLDEVWI